MAYRIVVTHTWERDGFEDVILDRIQGTGPEEPTTAAAAFDMLRRRAGPCSAVHRGTLTIVEVKRWAREDLTITTTLSEAQS